MSTDTEKIYYWRLTCLEENLYVWTWRSETEGAPTLCPNDHANRTNIDNVLIVGQVARNEVISTEPTMGFFEAQLLTIPMPAVAPGTTQSLMLTYPMNLEVWKTAAFVKADNVGDYLTVAVAPGAPLGFTTADAFINDTSIIVDATVINSPFLSRGMELKLQNGIVLQDLGRISNINKDLFTVSFVNPLTSNMPTGSTVRLYAYMLKDFKLPVATTIFFGDKGFRSKEIMAETPIVISCVNSDGAAKELDIHVEFYRS